MSTAMPFTVPKRLGYALKRAQHALRTAMDDALRPLGLTTPQYAVLCAVEAEQGLSNARLARAAFVTAQTMQAILANLERRGLLERHPHPKHGRILQAALTTPGRQILEEAHKAVHRIEQHMVQAIGEHDASDLTVSLTKCAEALLTV